MTFKTQQLDMRVSAYALGMVFSMLSKLRLPESQKSLCSSQFSNVAQGKPYYLAFLLG